MFQKLVRISILAVFEKEILKRSSSPMLRATFNEFEVENEMIRLKINYYMPCDFRLRRLWIRSGFMKFLTLAQFELLFHPSWIRKFKFENLNLNNRSNLIEQSSNRLLSFYEKNFQTPLLWEVKEILISSAPSDLHWFELSVWSAKSVGLNWLVFIKCARTQINQYFQTLRGWRVMDLSAWNRLAYIYACATRSDKTHDSLCVTSLWDYNAARYPKFRHLIPVNPINE